MESSAEILNGLFDKSGKKKELPALGNLPVKSIDSLIKELDKDKSLLEKYREHQPTELIKLQQRILNAITDDKLESASLSELTRAYVLLKDKELVMNGKATAITGIVGYLVALEKEEADKKIIEINSSSLAELESGYSVDPEEEEDLPNL